MSSIPDQGAKITSSYTVRPPNLKINKNENFNNRNNVYINLYLNNDKDRLNEIINYILGGIYEKENN